MDVFLVLAIVLAVSLLFAEIIQIFRIPAVLGYLLAGVALSFFPQLMSAESATYISVLSSIGIILLLFIAGLETNVHNMKKSGKEETLVAFLSAIGAFVAGGAVARAFGMDWTQVFIIGAMLSVTSEGTNIMTLLEFNKLSSKVGSIILGAGIIDDIIEIFTLSAVVMLIHAGADNLIYLVLKILLFIASMWLIFMAFVPLLSKRFSKIATHPEGMRIIVLMIFLFAGIASYMGLGPIIGAFFAGLLLQLMIRTSKARKHIENIITAVAFALIIPFFFINVGMNVKFQAFDAMFFAWLLLAAMAGKILGTMAIKSFSQLDWGQLLLMGFGMNSRGAMELIIAEIALTNGLISQTVYSAVVMVAFITTLFFPMVFRLMISARPDIMEA